MGPDDVRVSDIEGKFVCQVTAAVERPRPAEVRGNWIQSPYGGARGRMRRHHLRGTSPDGSC